MLTRGLQQYDFQAVTDGECEVHKRSSLLGYRCGNRGIVSIWMDWGHKLSGRISLGECRRLHQPSEYHTAGPELHLSRPHRPAWTNTPLTI